MIGELEMMTALVAAIAGGILTLYAFGIPGIALMALAQFAPTALF